MIYFHLEKTYTINNKISAMENLKRHILGSRSAGMSTTSEPRSVFHIGSSEDTLNQDMRDCYQGIEEFRSAMRNLDGAGTHLTESLAQALRGTDYQKVGEQLAGGFREVYGSQQMQHSLEQLKDMESMLLSLETRCKAGQEDPKLVYAQVSDCSLVLNQLVSTIKITSLPGACHHHIIINILTFFFVQQFRLFTSLLTLPKQTQICVERTQFSL